MQESKITISPTEFIAASTASSFVLSILYEYGYFSKVGYKILSIFTIEDFINSSINWLPKIMIFSIMFILYELTNFTNRNNSEIIENDAKYKIRNLNISKLIKNITPYNFTMIVFILLLTLHYFIDINENYISMICILFLICIKIYFLTLSLNKKSFYRIIVIAQMCIFLWLCNALLYFGSKSAESDINNSNKITIVSTQGNYKMLRKIANGAIAIDDKNSAYIYLKNDQIISIIYKKP